MSIHRTSWAKAVAVMTYPPILDESTDRDETHDLYGGSDKRRRARLPLHRPVQLTTSRGMVIAELMDIGEDGLRLRSSRPLDVDDELTVHVTLPAVGSAPPRRCSLDAKVVWRAGLVAGMFFTDSERARPRVQALLQRETAYRRA